MPFQQTVNMTQALAVAGDFASANPRASLISNEGGWRAGANGLTLGLFAWSDASGKLLSNSGTGAPNAFIHRNLQAQMTTYMSECGNMIPAGCGVGGAFSSGDFFALNAGSTAATVGMKAFANNATGTISFAAAGATVAGSTESKWHAQTAAAAGELVAISTTPVT